MKNFIDRCLAKGDKVISVRELGLIPSMPHRLLEAGCEIHILDVPLMAQRSDFDDEISFPYLVVEVYFPDGYNCFDKLFLSTITKVVHPVGTTCPVPTHGTFVDYVRSFVRWADVLPRIKDATIIVTDVKEYEIVIPKGDTRFTRVYGLDFLKK